VLCGGDGGGVGGGGGGGGGVKNFRQTAPGLFRC